jgi:hypothetical protein
MNESLVTGVIWHTGTVVLEAALVGGHWWLAVSCRVGLRVTEQSEQWGARRRGEGIGFDLQRQIRRGGGQRKWLGGENVGSTRPGATAVPWARRRWAVHRQCSACTARSPWCSGARGIWPVGRLGWDCSSGPGTVPRSQYSFPILLPLQI